MKPRLLGALCAGIILTGPSLTFAAAINQVDYSSLTGAALIGFEGLPGGTAPGTNYDGIIALNGAQFAERFIGQTLSASGISDVLGGTPVSSLSLQTGAPNQNLNIYPLALEGNVLAGLGPLGFPSQSAIGEGAVAILFDHDQSEFGFKSVGGSFGSAKVEFWGRDGSLIDAISLTVLGTQFFGFSREGGITDIAGISIWNTDIGGIGLDDVRFDVVPIPAALWLFGSGLVGLIGIGRKKAA
jgi:hypothetical protein